MAPTPHRVVKKSTSKQDNLPGWTTEQKFELLEALKEFGSFNIEYIKEYVSSKTAEEIKTALHYYQSKITITPPVVNKRERKINLPSVPLSCWANFIIDSHGFDNLKTETADGLRLIAEFEDIPLPVCTEKIDFRKLYHNVADALEGKPFPLDKNILAIFDRCIVETALTSKALNKTSPCFSSVLHVACNPVLADVNTFFKPTNEKELLYLRYLSSQKNYNPLNIPEYCLRFWSWTCRYS